MLTSRLTYFDKIDHVAEGLARDFANGRPITQRILETIIELYEAAKAEQHYKTDYFESAYHPPVTSDLEFFIARILVHYSEIKNLEWKILLRRQKSSTTPDIRLVKRDKTLP